MRSDSMRIAAALIVALGGVISACTASSPVMDAGNGNYYMIAAGASAMRGGTTGAYTVAYEEAQKFCAEKAPDLHAIVADAADHEVYHSAFAVSQNGAAGGSFGAGRVNLRFTCGT